MPKEGVSSPSGEQPEKGEASLSTVESDMSDIMSRLQVPHTPDMPGEADEDDGMLEYMKKPPPPGNMWDKMPPPVRIVRARATAYDWRRMLGCNRRTATRILLPILGGLVLLAILMSFTSRGGARVSPAAAPKPKSKAVLVDMVSLPPDGYTSEAVDKAGRPREKKSKDKSKGATKAEAKVEAKAKVEPEPVEEVVAEEVAAAETPESHLGAEASFTTLQLVKPSEREPEPDADEVSATFDDPIRIEEDEPAHEQAAAVQEQEAEPQSEEAAPTKVGGLSLPLISGAFLKSVMMGTASKEQVAEATGTLPIDGFTADDVAAQGAPSGAPEAAPAPATDRVPQCTKAKTEAVHHNWPAHPQMPSFKNDFCGDHQLRVDLNAAMRRRLPGDPPGYVAPPVVHQLGARPHISHGGSAKSIPRRLPPGKALHSQTLRAGLHFKPAAKPGLHKPGAHPLRGKGGTSHAVNRKGRGHRRLLKAGWEDATEDLHGALPQEVHGHSRSLLVDPIKVPNVAINSEEWKELNWFRRHEHVTPEDINLFSGDADTNATLVARVVHLLKEHADAKHSCHKRGQLCGAAGKHAGLNWCTGVLGACAVVGNGRSLHGKQNGEAIDKHDTIIRIGHVPITGHAPDVGQRTTITHQRSACYYPSTVESCKTQDFDVTEKWFHKERYPVPLIWHAQPLFGAPPVWVVDGKKPAFTTESMTSSNAAEALYAMLDPFVIRQGAARVRGKQSLLMPSNGFKVVMALLSSGLCSRIDAYGFTHDGVDHYFDLSGPAHMPTAGMSSYNVAGLEYFVLRVASAQGMVCLMN